MLATLARCFDVSLTPFNSVPGSCCDVSLRELSDQTVVLVLYSHVLLLLSHPPPITSILTDRFGSLHFLLKMVELVKLHLLDELCKLALVDFLIRCLYIHKVRKPNWPGR